MKRFILIIALFVGIVHVNADNKLVVPSVIIPQGGSAEIEIALENTDLFTSFQMTLNLPQGVSFVSCEGGTRLVDHTLSPTLVDEMNTLLPCYPTNLTQPTNIAGNSGVLFKLTLSADETLTTGTIMEGIFNNVKFSDFDELPIPLENISFTITIGEPADTRTILDETSTSAPVASDGAVDVRVRRTIKANEWSTICLPFAMTATQVKDAFGENVALGDFKGYDFDGESIAVNFEDVSAMEANRPYIIKVQKAVSEFIVDGVEVTPSAEPMINYGTKRKPKAFIGTYVAGTEIENGCLFLNNNQFWYSVGSTKCKAFRAYFNFDDLLPEFEDNYAEVRAAIIFLDNTSGLCEIVNGKSSNGKWYDLSGRQMVNGKWSNGQIQKGVYIINGQKKVVR